MASNRPIWTVDNFSLIYDGYLRKYNASTIDIKSEKFKNYLIETISLFYYWFDYFNNNQVKAIIVSHTVYEFGIILRVAIAKEVKAYSVGSFFIFSHDQNDQTIFDMKYYAALLNDKMLLTLCTCKVHLFLIHHLYIYL